MGTKTIRLDDETEQILQQIIQSTGLYISGAFKKGLFLLHREIEQHTHLTPYDVYKELNLGPAVPVGNLHSGVGVIGAARVT
jgi:hypothetical protein